MIGEILRVAGVIALLGAAAALATPKGRLPLALRGVYRILKRDRGETPSVPAAVQAPLWRRLLAFIFVLAAVLTALLSF